MADDHSIQSILNRPTSERIREYKYRFAQCMVFGLPVIALHLFGPKLGGAETGRWTGLLEALLAGWCMYIAALPMLSEGAMLMSLGKMKFELVLAVVAVILYVLGIIGWIYVLRGRTPLMETSFSIVVILLILWSAVHWFRLSR